MRLAVRTCYDFLRAHQRNRETSFTELSQPETDWLDQFVVDPGAADEKAEAARQLIHRILGPPPALRAAGHHPAGNRGADGQGNRRI